jgi:hypothetical protein
MTNRTPTINPTDLVNVEFVEKQENFLTLTHPICNMNGMKGISLKQHWHCPRCKVSVTTYITLSTPPQHRCVKAANQPKPLTPSEGDTNE